MSIVVELDRPLPARVPVGCATAVFCVGACCHPEQPIERLEILVDGVPHRPAAFGMPRPDKASYYSGFWGTVPVHAGPGPGHIELAVAAWVASGERLTAALGEIEVVARTPTPPGTASAPGLIAVCMATFEPDPALFDAQIASLRAQSDERWLCVISDDCSGAEQFAAIELAVAGDPRFQVSRSDARLGFYRNFERALGMVPADAQLVALCDQDDRWHPDKLSTLRAALGESVLVYSDQRLVDAGGALLRETMWRGRRNNYDSLASMLIANTITGAATLFRRELTDVLLPFPDTPGFQFHDHWLGLVALAAGEIAYVDRALYDYVQHPGAVFGDVTHGRGGANARQPGHWKAAYFYGYLPREAQAQALLVRCQALLTGSKRRALERFIACDSSIGALTWLALRPARVLAGRTETLGSETELAGGILWKRLTAARARHWPRPGGRLSDASAPPLDSFSQRRLRRWRAGI